MRMVSGAGDTLTRFTAWLDREGDRLEQQVGRRATGLLCGLFLLILAAVYAGENFLPLGFGRCYADLSRAPLDFATDSPFRLRLFAPLLGYALGLRGNWFPLLTHGASVLFLAVLYIHLRNRAWRPHAALGLAAVFGFSITVLNEIHFPGFTDPLSWLLLLGAMLSIRRPVRWGTLCFLALANHESNLFAVPWLALLALQQAPSARARVVAVAASLLAVAAFWAVRTLLESVQSGGPAYSAAFYLNRDNLRDNAERIRHTWALGAFQAFKLAWLLPAAGLAVAVRERRLAEAALLLAIVAAAAAQLALAEDVTRLLGLAFPAVLLGARRLHESWGEARTGRLLWILWGLGLLVPQVTVFGPRVVRLHSLPYTIYMQLVHGIPLP